MPETSWPNAGCNFPKHRCMDHVRICSFQSIRPVPCALFNGMRQMEKEAYQTLPGVAPEWPLRRCGSAIRPSTDSVRLSEPVPPLERGEAFPTGQTGFRFSICFIPGWRKLMFQRNERGLKSMISQLFSSQVLKSSFLTAKLSQGTMVVEEGEFAKP